MGDLTVISSDLTPAEQLFVEQYAKTGDPLKAWITARITPNPLFTREVQVERLMEKPAIKAAIEAIGKRQAQKRPVRKTRETLLEDYETIFDKAMETGDLTNANKAKDSQARLLGMMVEKREVVVSSNPGEMNTTELLKALTKSAEGQKLLETLKVSKMIDVTPKAVDGQPA